MKQNELVSFDLDARTVTLRFDTEASVREFICKYADALAKLAAPEIDTEGRQISGAPPHTSGAVEPPAPAAPTCPECDGVGQVLEDGAGALGYVVTRPCPNPDCTARPNEPRPGGGRYTYTEPRENQTFPKLDEASMDRAWNSAIESLRTQGADVDALIARAARVVEAHKPSTGGWQVVKTSCHCNREDDGHGWAVLYQDRMVRCLGCLRDATRPAVAPVERRSFWRSGYKLGRTLYRDDKCIGIVDTPELAGLICIAVNAFAGWTDDDTTGVLRCAVCGSDQPKLCVAYCSRHLPRTTSSSGPEWQIGPPTAAEWPRPASYSHSRWCFAIGDEVRLRRAGQITDWTGPGARWARVTWPDGPWTIHHEKELIAVDQPRSEETTPCPKCDAVQKLRGRVITELITLDRAASQSWTHERRGVWSTLAHELDQIYGFSASTPVDVKAAANEEKGR